MSRELLGLVIIVATALLSSVIYVIGGGYRRKDQNEIGDRGGFILGSFMRSWLYWFLGPLERLAVRLRMSPSTFNLLGVALGVTAGFCFGSGDLNSAGWLVLLSGAVDVLDVVRLVAIILNDDGSLNKNAQLYLGKDRFEVRKQITIDLKEKGFLQKILQV